MDNTWDMPMSDRQGEYMVCDQCGEELDPDGECILCWDAYLDAMESRSAQFDQYGEDSDA